MKQISNTNRRIFLRQSMLVSLGFLALPRCTANYKPEEQEPAGRPVLVKDPRGYLDLPAGFSYRIIARKGERMADNLLVPGRPDGMGAFQGSGDRVILICNHENSPAGLSNSPFGPQNELLRSFSRSKLYDAGSLRAPGLGGTTTLIYNEKTGELEQQFLSLAGTYRNCAGGVTPWGSWLTCEEDTSVKQGSMEQDHGFVFEVPATETPFAVEPIPITAMGRFNHEAVAVDPATGIVYQTEDRQDGLFYRYIPNQKGNLHAGGKLQALAIIDQPALDTRNWKTRKVPLQTPFQTHWVDIQNVQSPKDNLRYQGFEKGAARFARGEGIWFGDGELFFACTNGGPSKYGQVFRYQPSPAEGTPQEQHQPGLLELFAESTDRTLLHACDNLTVAPSGDLFLCEDNGVLNHIRGINRQGEVYTFACNRSSKSELAGAVFSPSGKTLFVNIQE
ncbi:MAG: DUF839 domain-containing protein, partial [Phaeodactylibacter sp.]|nr:DUF839 domain-containing protein [Phaeodactylibacter sp.]